MRATELIGLLQSMVEVDGDLDVVVCGFDGAGFDPVGSVVNVPAVRVDAVGCQLCEPDIAHRLYGADPAQHSHYFYIHS